MRSRKKEKLVFQLFFPDFAVQKDSKIKGLNYSVKKKKKAIPTYPSNKSKAFK